MKNKELVNFFLTLFDWEDEISLSKTKYGYFSVPLSEFLNDNPTITLIGQKNGQPTSSYTFYKSNLELVAINAVKGARLDANVTKYRSFLIEIDNMSLVEQSKYIVEKGVPLSVAVYSGNKSIHFGISLKTPLLSKEEYAYYAKWLLNILSKADQNTKNPTRSIRIPFVKRHDTGKVQELLYSNGRVDNNDFLAFLNHYKHLAPKQNGTSLVASISEERLKELKESGLMVDLRALPYWAIERLKMARNGTLKANGYSRNATVYAIAYELFKLGYPYDIVLMFIMEWFPEEPDFLWKEIESTVKSAFNRVRQ